MARGEGLLEPNSRQLLVDALRPPIGSKLDLAVGTTYSVDLLSLLVTPLAFAMFDREDDEDGSPDPVALLEAVRRHAQKMHLYCQAGLISLPREYQPLLAYVEDRVFEAAPPNRSQIFHPKVWILRFRGRDEVTYRLVCATRNLTFANAWDTVLVLEGQAGEETLEENLPLRDFVAALPDLAVRTPSEDDRKAVRDLAGELMRVEFEDPPGFDGHTFVSLGLNRESTFPGQDAKRLLVMSPFLTKGALTRLRASGAQHVLVSRPESLDAIGRAGLQGFETYVLHEAADDGMEDERSTITDEAIGERAQVDPSGLHAKLFVADYAGYSSVWTGSANATDAAFNGNVEFLVELIGPTKAVGLKALMRTGEGRTSFRDLLERHDPPSDNEETPTTEELLDKRLDKLQRELAARPFEANIESHGDGTYSITLESEGTSPAIEGLKASCWPISVKRGLSKPVTSSLTATFTGLPRQDLTAFFAFELEAREGGVSRRVTFVVSAKLIGAPNDRREQILADLLNDRAKVLRFLLLLLADESDGFQLLEKGSGSMTGDFRMAPGSSGLFESMVRVLSSDPSRLDHIDRLVRDLVATQRHDLLPEQFEDVWAPIWAVRNRVAK